MQGYVSDVMTLGSVHARNCKTNCKDLTQGAFASLQLQIQRSALFDIPDLCTHLHYIQTVFFQYQTLTQSLTQCCENFRNLNVHGCHIC